MARVLITGCSSGIGRGTAIAFTKSGHQVVATARRLETLDDLDADLKLTLDVTDEVSVGAALAVAGEIDVLVNNAGVVVAGPAELLPLDEVRAMVETNLLGALRLIQSVLPTMRQRGSGTIINVTGVSGRIVFPLSSAYCATKFALEALSESLRLEVGHFGIRVFAVEPGQTATRMADNAKIIGDDGPYGPLVAWSRGFHGAPGADPESVGRAIVALLESPDVRLRHPVGDDADFAIRARASMDDAAFESAFRTTTHLDW